MDKHHVFWREIYQGKQRKEELGRKEEESLPSLHQTVL